VSKKPLSTNVLGARWGGGGGKSAGDRKKIGGYVVAVRYLVWRGTEMKRVKKEGDLLRKRGGEGGSRRSTW